MDSKNIRPHPLKCRPLFKAKPWGGRKMEEIFRKNLPPGEMIGEAWEAADLGEGASFIAGGPLDGSTLTEAVRLWGRDLIGEKWGRADRFPLLVKIIDARQDLSVQVHPDRTACEKYFPNHHSKDESWIILESDPGGGILRGFEKDVDLDVFINRREKDDVVSILRRLDVKKGDAIRIPPGTVHALLGGVMLLEIQEPSDSTFRIYDYGRIVDGRPRPLHIEEAEKVMRFDWVENPYLEPEKEICSWGSRELIVDCPAYRIERWAFSGSINLEQLKETVRVLLCIEGKIDLESEQTSFAINPGETVIIPAATSPVRLNSLSGAKIVAAGTGGVEIIKKKACFANPHGSHPPLVL